MNIWQKKIFVWFVEAWENFHLSEEENFHISRMFRSTLHGFITLTQLGYFRQSGSISKEESFTYMVDHLLSRLDNPENI